MLYRQPLAPLRWDGLPTTRALHYNEIRFPAPATSTVTQPKSSTKTPNEVKRIATLLQSRGGRLQPLLDRARLLQELNTNLREALGAPLGSHITLCDVHGELALLAADSPVWLTRLRYQAPAVLHALRQQPGLAGLRRVQFKVWPASEPVPSPPPRRATYSPQGAAVLNETAAHTPDHALAAALHRLANSIAGKK